MTLVNQIPVTQKLNLYIEQKPEWPGSPKIICGIRACIITFLIKLHILAIAVRSYGNVVTAGKVLYGLILEKKRIIRDKFPTRYMKADKRYYWSVMTTGWPSPAFKNFIENELVRIRPFAGRTNHLQILNFAITSKCSLRCEHCYEWDNLNSKEVLETGQLKRVIHDFLDKGVSQIQLSGGEPINRFDDLLEVLRTAKHRADFWLLTSGFGLDLEKARKLKQAGLTGVTISLDHWSEAAHNHFRKNVKSFYWVKKAVLNCNRVNLLTSLSLCATKEFISHDNLWKYLRMAKLMGVGFVRILEPRQVGRYANKDVELSEGQLEQLRQFYLSVNSDSRYRNWAIVSYHGCHQLQYRCFAADDRFLYVDPRGEIHTCPFCRNSAGTVFSTPVDVSIERMQSRNGCSQIRHFGQDMQSQHQSMNN